MSVIVSRIKNDNLKNMNNYKAMIDYLHHMVFTCCFASIFTK